MLMFAETSEWIRSVWRLPRVESKAQRKGEREKHVVRGAQTAGV